MKIWHIGDTHTYHGLLDIPEDIDVVIHSGDASNSNVWHINDKELLDFFSWFKVLPIKHKVFVAGNHDVSFERSKIWQETLKKSNISYLENSSVRILGFNIYGSPYTPTYGTKWSFQKSRQTINRIWDAIPVETDILVTHGPPKGILDYTLDRKNKLESVGDSALAKAIERVKPDLHLFGHVHNFKYIKNSGQFLGNGRIYSNGSVVEDGKFGELLSNGNIIDLERED